MTNQTIAHYKITEKLGEGGMGEVYRARDTKLNRDVALKILPQAFAQDSQRMARFEREAHVLASLNHPHVAQIYGLEDADGTKALVLELVEGETLAEQIARGPIPVDEALKIALQICEGLEAAHEKGIIHRDLKPANIKITPEGQVKILDFGLAKAMEGETLASDLSHSPTITHEATKAGVILGTASYMSPEQARGKPVDKRADIWAFGCVLYEMLTGVRAFDGESLTDVFASIVKEEITLESLPKSAPQSIHRLIRRCLDKNRKDRLHDVGDAGIVIRESLLWEDDQAFPPVIQGRRNTWGWFTGLGLTCLVVGVVLGFWMSRDRDARNGLSQTPSRFEVVSKRSLLDWWLHRFLAISPHGDRIVWVVDSWEEENLPLFLRSLDERHAVPLPGTEDGYGPFFSPDGKWLGFFQEGQLKKIATDGGTPILVCDATNAFGGDWGPDGTIVFNNLPWEGLWQVSERGGEPKRLTNPNRKGGEDSHWYPNFLPDGKGILFGIWYGETRFNLALLDVESGLYRVILEDVTYAVYSNSGHLVFARPDGLYAVGFDLEEKTLRGSEIPVDRDLLVNRFRPHAHFDLSENGTLVCLAGSPWLSELVLVDLEGKETPLDLPPGAYQNPRFSPDGNRIAFNLYEGHSVETWVFDRKSGRRYKLPSEGNNIVPNWHPEGDRISFYSDREGAGKWKYYWQKVDGTAEPEPLFDAKQEGYGWFGAQDWSPDGKILIGPGSLEFSDDTERGAELLYLPLEDSPQLSLLIERQRRVGLHGTSFSPNGKWVAFVADEAGAIGSTAQVYVTRFPEGGQKWMVSKEGGTCPVWSPDGKRIYFEKSRHMMVVDLETEPEPEAGEPRALWNFTENKYSAGDDYTRPNWDISPDGGYFIVTREAADREPPTNVNVTTNFFEVLREKVPTE